MLRRVLRVGMLLAAGLFLWPVADELIRHWPAWLHRRSPHDRYARELRDAGLDRMAAGSAWMRAADGALEAPEDTGPAFVTSGRLDPLEEPAFGWRFDVRRGRRLAIDVAFGGRPLFIDLFRASGGEHLASAPRGSASLRYDIDRDMTVIARLQPELSGGGRYQLVQRAEATLRFPVPRVTAAAVRSTFGDPRDAGARRHEGIDIFAPRGTPVVAATDGWITSRTSNRLGGNVVWLSSLSPRVALYYAHLDRQAVSPGERVRAGDVVGYIGNTGNARGTAPHLHFGVYARPGGAVDPFPYVCSAPCGERVMHQAEANWRAP